MSEEPSAATLIRDLREALEFGFREGGEIPWLAELMLASDSVRWCWAKFSENIPQTAVPGCERYVKQKWIDVSTVCISRSLRNVHLTTHNLCTKLISGDSLIFRVVFYLWVLHPVAFYLSDSFWHRQSQQSFNIYYCLYFFFFTHYMFNLDNIRMDLGEVGWSDVDWIGLAQDRNRWRALVNSVLNLRVPW
jgi:hypothetical protein